MALSGAGAGACSVLGSEIYRFGPLELDTVRVELRAQGQPQPVEPQVFALLALLVANRERLVSKDEILEKIWDGRIVSEAAVASRIKSARRALGDDGQAQQYIRTVQGQGLRFVAAVQARRAEPAARDGMEAVALDPVSRPSIAVLPFEAIGTPGPCAAISEALPHELITELARLRWLFVTARGSSFRCPAAGTDLGEVGRLLGVRYVLTGCSAPRPGPRPRRR